MNTGELHERVCAPFTMGQGPEPAVVFVNPKLAVRVRYLGWEAGRLRHAAYRGVA
jgi:hypothetical protein